MKAAVYENYGPAETVSVTEIPTPVPGRGEVLIRVGASALSTADWRLRASAFPGGLWLAGRLYAGLFRPRNRVLGTDVAGVVAAVGPGVTRFAPGDRIFGFIGSGGHADYAVAPETAALHKVPEGLPDAEAAALPFGGLAALVFLRDVAQLRPGQSVLIVGASGGVGAYATQIAKALGARVTAVAGAENADFLRDLGADEVLDYRKDDLARGPERHDLVFDTVGATTWPMMRKVLKKDGLFLPLNFGLRDLGHLLRARIAGGPRMALHVNDDRPEDLAALVTLLEQRKLRPVIGARFPLERIVEAHRFVEARHKRGAVVIEVAEPAEQRLRA